MDNTQNNKVGSFRGDITVEIVTAVDIVKCLVLLLLDFNVC